MPVVIKFGLTHSGTLCEQFVTLGHSGKKLVKGQLWAEVTQVMI